MYSILGKDIFCFNYCLNSAWHGGDQFVALLRWCEAQVSLTVAFRSGEFKNTNTWSFNQLLVLLAVWAGAVSSILKKKKKIKQKERSMKQQKEA